MNMTGGKRYPGMESIGNYQLGKKYDTSNLSLVDKENMFMHCVLMCEDAYTKEEATYKSITDKTTKTARRNRSTTII